MNKTFGYWFIICIVVLIPRIAPAANSDQTSSAEERLIQDINKLEVELAKKRQALAALKGPPVAPTTQSHSQTTASGGEEATPAIRDVSGGIVRTVSLRKSVFDQHLFGDPAEMTYTHPGQGNDSYVIDAGLKV